MRRRTVLKSSALLALSALSSSALGSCSQPSSTQATPGATSAASSAGPLRVALVPWIGWSRAHIAEVKGFFTEMGLAVEQTVFQTVSEVNTALLAKKVDLAWLVAADLVVLSDKAPDLKFILASDYSGDVDAVIGAGVSTPDSVKGKKFAIEDVPYEVVFAAKYLESIGLTLDDVEVLPLTVPDGTASLIAGNVDLVATYEPFLSKALKEKAGAQVLFSAKGTNIIANGLAGSSGVLSERQEQVMMYLKAMEKAVQFAKTSPEEANAIVAKWVGVTAPEVKDLMAKLDLLDTAANKAIAFNADHALSAAKSIDAAVPVLLKAGKAKVAIKGADYVDASFVKAMA